jgi:hypothetical protein
VGVDADRFAFQLPFTAVVDDACAAAARFGGAILPHLDERQCRLRT